MLVHLLRDSRAEEFPNLLLDIGDGKIFEEEGSINIPGNLCDVVGDLISFSDRIYPNILQAREDCTSWPVSYTHLDVYKRQMYIILDLHHRVLICSVGSFSNIS